jgi:C-terminal processing protease CtpA/Prc
MKKFAFLFIFTAMIFILSAPENFAQNAGEQPDMMIDAAVRAETIDTLFKDLNESYVFPEVAKRMETDVRNRLKTGEYDQLTSAREFAKKLTDDLRAVSKDKHLGVRFSNRVIPLRAKRGEPSDAEREEFKRMMRINNYGFVKVEVMRGNIGYIDFRGFTNPEFGAETVAAAMNFVNNSDALIFDLRQNGGGDPAMVALICSYLFGDKPVHLNDLYWRKENRTEEYWTKPNVSGKKYNDKEVYVLTSNRTFSGAEEFSYNLKNLKRATIVGETTGGGAHPGDGFRLSDHFEAFIPTGRAISPITKTNWEGTGVEPDVKIPQEQALKTAYLLALNKSLEKSKDDNLKNALKRIIEQTQKELNEVKKGVAQK